MLFIATAIFGLAGNFMHMRKVKIEEKIMKIMPMGDYYVWYCEWCDSKNLTLWTRVEKDEVLCGACQRGLSYTGPFAADAGGGLSAIL